METHWKSAALIVLIATLGIASAWAPLSIGNRRLHPPPLPTAEIPLALTQPLTTPSAIREHRVATLSRINYLLAAGSLVVTFCSLLVLSAARAQSRRNEILVHRAVGASRKQLLLRGLREGGALAIAVALLGLGLGASILQLAARTWPGTSDAPALLAPAVLLIAMMATILLGVLGPLKSLGTMQPSLPPLTPILAPALCALQLAVCFAVLVQSKQVAREGASLTRGAEAVESPGMVYQLELPASAAERSHYLRDLMQRSPLVDLASISSPGALEGLGTLNTTIIECGACSLGGIATPLRPVAVSLSIVSADTFRALNAELVEGRLLSGDDDWSAERTAVVTRNLARAHFQEGQALGRLIHIGQGKDNAFKVVGVVADRRMQGYAVYASVLQVPPTVVDFLVRSRGHVEPPAGSIREAMPEDQWRARNAAPIRWFGNALWFEGSAVVLIALLGIAAAIAMWVASMLPELAVRRCVGARRRDVLAHVAYRTARVLAAGLALGWAFVELTSDPLSAIMPALQSLDAAGFLQVALIVAGMTALGVSVPAWRARTLEPVVLLSKSGE